MEQARRGAESAIQSDQNGKRSTLVRVAARV